MVVRVLFAAGSSASAPSAARTVDSSVSSSISMPSKTMFPVVIVPVLSMQTTLTRASPSTAGSSCTRTCSRVNFNAALKKASVVRRTKPSGTRPTSPPTARIAESRQLSTSLSRNCDQICSGAAKTRIQVMYFNSLLMEF